MTKLEQLVLRICDQYQSVLPNQIRPSMVAFFVNPDKVKWRQLKPKQNEKTNTTFL